jgi:hypothetical protein
MDLLQHDAIAAVTAESIDSTHETEVDGMS